MSKDLSHQYSHLKWCDYCGSNIDPDDDPCHWNNEGQCEIERDDWRKAEAQFHAEGQIKQTKIDRRTGHDKRWPDPNRGR